MPALAEIPASANVADVVGRRAAEQPQAVILRRKTADGRWDDVTASQFAGEVEALAKGFIAAGIGAGDRVALMSHTRYEWTLIDYALWTAGAIVVPVYETSSAEQAEWILSNSGACAVIAETDAFASMIAKARERLPALEKLWKLEEDLPALIAGGADVDAEALASRARARTATDIATLIYTSGTTGRPKGCELTHENLLAAVRNTFMGPLAAMSTVEDASTLLFLPLAHVFARIIEVGCFEGGLVLGHCQDMNDLLPDLASFRPSFVLAVPRVFEKVYNGAEARATSEGRGKIFGRAAKIAITYSESLDSPGRPSLGVRAEHALYDRLVYGKLRAALGGRTRWALSGGAALSPRLGHFFRGVGVSILEGYGLTETSAPVSVNRPDRQKIGSVGQPLPGVAVRLGDDDEILVRGKSIFPGYWRDETATKEAFDADGWYATGDLGQLDDEGFLSITGRKKEIIVTAGGKNVAPSVLEDRMRTHALISQCMVVGDGRPFVGVLVTIDQETFGPWKERHGKPATATVADLRDDPDLNAEIQVAVDDANMAVSRAESIRKFRILDGDFTQEQGHLSAKLGIRRAVLAKEFAHEIEALYSQAALLVDEGAEGRGGGVPAPVAFHPGAALHAHRLRAVGVGEQGDEAVGQGGNVPAADHVARLAVLDRVGGTAGIAAHHGQARRGRLQVDDAEALHVEAAAPGPARHREHVTGRVMPGKLGLRDRAREVNRASKPHPVAVTVKSGGVRAVADDHKRGVVDLPQHPRPRPQQGVLTLARDQAGNADHHGTVGQAVARPDRRAGVGVGPERGRVDAGVQPGHARGGGRGEGPRKPEPEVLAEVGDDIRLIADAAEHAARDRQGGPAGLVPVRDGYGPFHAGPPQNGCDQAKRRRGAEDDRRRPP
jgi:long-chain acyl-CoA synthetase